MHLPHDVPNAYFHADVSDGGLSIPSFRWTMPLQRLNRLKGLKTIEDEQVPEAMINSVEKEIKRTQLRLKDQGLLIDSNAVCKSRLAKLLHSSNDGVPLQRSRAVARQHVWITDGNMFLSGRYFIHINKLRINAVPLRSRTARGRIRDRNCRAGCRAAGTLQRVLQQCHRTHNARIRRHNACLEYLLKRLKQPIIVDQEPHFKTTQGLLKPDVIVIKKRLL